MKKDNKNNVNADNINKIVPSIVYVPTSEIKIYMVKESQLNELEKGSQSDLFLEIGIASASIFVSFFIALLTATCTDRVFISFFCVCLITFIASVVLFILWYRLRRNRKSIINEIRSNESLNKDKFEI